MDRDVAASVRMFCDDAWHHRKPTLRHFSLEMLVGPDGTSEARSSGSFRIDSLVAA